MSLTLWTQLMAAVKDSIRLILSNSALKETIKITVINYGSTARIVFKEQEPHLDLIDKIKNNGGGTDFENALTLTYDTLLESKSKYDIYTIGFLTDGQAGYPQKIIDRINEDSENVKSKINFNCILFGNQSSNLETISNSLNANYTNAINFEQLKNSFKEILIPIKK